MTRPRIALAALGLFIAGCASPPSHFYTLSSALAPGAGVAPPSGGVAVAVGPVSIPAQVDRPEILVSEGANRVRPQETERWAAPLADNIARVVAENLADLLATARVTRFPQTTDMAAAYRVLIDVQGFTSVPDQAATLGAVWTVRRTQDGRSETGRTRVREPVTGAGYEALAAAHSRALGTLSRDIADALRRLIAAAPAGDAGNAK
ncbi:membrane integrity-associated transporter subunit PqiC [uncultured Thiodictyon sp.]|uniref:PqiC family protein n=1 Tax=uncultured Thiodictyon sp. TaxID=1846217 RepID=UPI0025D5BFAC|nr:PqiC family protein [uncultured Thiodictyon sp.]